MEQDYWSGQSTPSTGFRSNSRYELRPLAAGEILDRVISIYRGNFWLLVALSSIPAGVVLILQIARIVTLQSLSGGNHAAAYGVITVGSSLLLLAAYVIGYGITSAGVTAAIHATYLNGLASVDGSLRVAKKLWLRCLGIALWQGWSATWVLVAVSVPLGFVAALRSFLGVLGPLLMVLGLIAAGVYGIVAYLRNSLAVPAAVVEDLSVRVAMRRSKKLATGRIGRIFLLFVLVYTLWLAIAAVQIPLAFVLLRNHDAARLMMQAALLALNFVASSLMGPLVAIGLALFYFDERVRREGFDIEVLLGGSSDLPASPPPPPLPTPAPADSTPAVYVAAPEQL